MNAVAAQTSGGTGAPAEKSWSRPIWLLVVLLTCAGQVGLIFLLGTRQSIQPRAPSPAPPVTLVGDKFALLVELTDPTLFVLPNRHGFSGSARAMTPRNEFVATDWNEPFRWLQLSAGNLGETFQQLLATGLTPPVAIVEKTEPRIAPLVTVPAFTLPAQSSLRIEGGLPGRKLLSDLNLPSWPSADVLKPSAVQVLVETGGRVVSATLLGSSELAEADQRALELARTARFEPAANPQPDLVRSRMFFVWHTIPLPTADETATPQPLP